MCSGTEAGKYFAGSKKIKETTVSAALWMMEKTILNR